MANVAIRIENLTKEYRLGVINHGTLRQDLESWWARVRGRDDPNSPVARQERGSAGQRFRALNHLSLEIGQGGILGIIGRNGAGKSTLLKILSRVTAPTSGEVRIRGRVASLLEVGTGFHPELTGRENVFLNGAILGMSRGEIRRKFDEIVDFSEVGQFIDTPVKRYSSGMYVRLAFAVAANLEPEVMIVDEVLAVGDVGFQKKCLAKMNEVSRSGRTVLFVSHNMTAVRNLCERTVWLDEGRIFRDGPTLSVTDEYLRQTLKADSLVGLQDIIASLPDDPVLRIEQVTLLQQGGACTSILNGLPVEIEFMFTVRQRTAGLRMVLEIQDGEGNILVRSFHDDDADEPAVLEPGAYRIKAVIPADFLAPRIYDLRFYGTIHNVRSIPPGGICIPLTVAASNGINRAYPHEPIRSKLQPRIPWSAELLR